MIPVTGNEILIGLTHEEAMTMLNALKVLGQKARTETQNDLESEWYREQWSEYVAKVIPIYKSMEAQIKAHGDEFTTDEATGLVR